VGRDIFASIKNLVGGEIEEYTKLQATSREQALSRMIEDANNLEADAIVNVRFMTSGNSSRSSRSSCIWYGSKD
jgi:uncharacterized protein YbjQ (UPF0145 family)